MSARTQAQGQALAEAARGLIGVRFRLHGRDPATGLDCIGVLVAALAAIGRAVTLPAAYTLRTREPADLAALAARCGLIIARPPVAAGDVLLTRPGACQFHLLVALTARRFVHAHAGLRRVVMLESACEAPITGVWRLADHGRG